MGRWCGPRQRAGIFTDLTQAHREEGGSLRRRRRRWRGGSAASTHKGSLRRVSRPSPHGRPSRRSQRLSDKVHVVRLLQLGCLEKGRKGRETRSEIYQEKYTKVGIQFESCFCTAQNINFSTHTKHAANILRHLKADN